MPFIKGKPKTGGRKKGTTNKSTNELRSVLSRFVSAKYEELDEIFEQLAPKEKIDAISKISEFVLPKLERVPIEPQKTEEKQPQIIQIGETTISFS